VGDRAPRWWPAALAAAVAVIVAGSLPSIQARAKAVAVVTEAFGIPFPRPLAPPVHRIDASLDGVTGHLYLPDRRAPAIVLLPGAAPRGKDDPRAVRLARALAHAGRVVFVPDLTLAERRLDPEDVERVVRAVEELSADPRAEGPMVLVGISYGGSYAMVAAADPRLRGRVALVATFGAFFDLMGVIQAASTGATLVAGMEFPWQGHPMARAVLEAQATALLPAADRPGLQAALDGTGDPNDLGPAAGAVYDLLANRDPARTPDLFGRLPEDIRERLDSVAPASVVDRLQVPVIAMHSVDDPAVPYAEFLRLARAFPQARLVSVESFRHVDLKSGGGWGGAAGALRGVWRFGSWLLEAQE
jgi:acetyl esterase/lipase